MSAGNLLSNPARVENLPGLIRLSRKAGEAILSVYRQDGPISVLHKEDQSPVTIADLAAHRIITEALRRDYPDIPVISEEMPSDMPEGPPWPAYFWLVDPLDGTREFICKNDEFTVNIALIENGCPVIGIVHVPAQQLTYYAAKGHGSFKISGEAPPIAIQSGVIPEDGNIVVISSRHHTSSGEHPMLTALRRRYSGITYQMAGSSLKFCYVAEGSADIYPRPAPTMIWDTAAAHCIVMESGKQIYAYPSNQPLFYDLSRLTNPPFICQ